jgi:hypothetical protein
MLGKRSLEKRCPCDGGTDGSNPSPSREESAANLTSSREITKAGTRFIRFTFSAIFRGCAPRKVRFAGDSPLEEAGFEPLVSRKRRHSSPQSCSGGGAEGTCRSIGGAPDFCRLRCERRLGGGDGAFHWGDHRSRRNARPARSTASSAGSDCSRRTVIQHPA